MGRDLRLDYNMVRAKKQPLQVGDKRLILLAVLTNAWHESIQKCINTMPTKEKAKDCEGCE